MDAHKVFKLLKPLPLGRKLFSRMVCFRAPYFATIKPVVTELRPGHCQVKIKNRRKVRNHLGTVHAIALCNMAELAGGLTVDATRPKHLRWVPKSMQVQYLSKATGDLKADCYCEGKELKVGDNTLTVNVANEHDEIVFKADICFYISEKKKSA